MINTAIIYLTVSCLIFFFISKISYFLNLVDKPNKRKIHLKPTAFTGGIALCFIYIFSIYLFDFTDRKLNLIFSAAFLISFVGFVDDKYSLNVGGKLSLQIIPIIYLILFENFSLNQIGDYNYFKLELNTFSVPFTLLCVMLLINSFNYFDGLDGTLSVTTISTLVILIFLVSSEKINLFLIVFLIPILIFLFFNFSILNLPKLFYGDSGSLSLGFIISFILIYLANQKIIHPILLAFSISIFVYEFLSINLIRTINKKGIFNAGVDHLHHILLRRNNSLFLTNFIISITNIILFTIGYLSFILISPLTSLILFILLFIIFFVVRKKIC